MRPRHRLLAAAAWTFVGTIATATEAERSPLWVLRQGGELAFQPTLAHFCENMHVRCAGQTNLATFAIKLRGASGNPFVALVTGDQGQSLYEDAKVEWADDGSYLLVSPRTANGDLKLLADGKYVFRHYIQDRGVMSLGHCK